MVRFLPAWQDHQRCGYSYTGPVRLGPHTLRLRPREGHDLRIESASLSIRPVVSVRWHRDAEDNCLAMAGFQASADELWIESHLSILQDDGGSLLSMEVGVWVREL
ncbi:MAG: transglutaminase N-terminal domain-containing protein [Cyanobium sp. CZS 25K]|nr:transglutaminase N-terminal domain-containing protein [Cyanobium sp. CZS25K]